MRVLDGIWERIAQRGQGRGARHRHDDGLEIGRRHLQPAARTTTWPASQRKNMQEVGGVTVHARRAARSPRALRKTLGDPDASRSAPQERVRRSEATRSTPASTDLGDVSWNVPTVEISTATWVPGVPAHSWQAVACDGMSIGVKGMMVAAKTMALTGYDLFTQPAHVQKARRSSSKRRGAGCLQAARCRRSRRSGSRPSGARGAVVEPAVASPGRYARANRMVLDRVCRRAPPSARRASGPPRCLVPLGSGHLRGTSRRRSSSPLARFFAGGLRGVRSLPGGRLLRLRTGVSVISALDAAGAARFSSRIASARVTIFSNSSPAWPPRAGRFETQISGWFCERMSAKSPPLLTRVGKRLGDVDRPRPLVAMLDQQPVAAVAAGAARASAPAPTSLSA